jgi:hypothetical protein
MRFYVAASLNPNVGSPYLRLLEPRMSHRQTAEARELADHCIANGFDEHDCNVYEE